MFSVYLFIYVSIWLSIRLCLSVTVLLSFSVTENQEIKWNFFPSNNQSLPPHYIPLLARSIGYLFGSILGGILADVINPACAMALPLFICSVATVLIPWMTHTWSLGVTMTSKGLGAGMLDTGASCLLCMLLSVGICLCWCVRSSLNIFVCVCVFVDVLLCRFYCVRWVFCLCSFWFVFFFVCLSFVNG